MFGCSLNNKTSEIVHGFVLMKKSSSMVQAKCFVEVSTLIDSFVECL